MNPPLPRWWFGAPPSLRLDECFIESHPANRTQGKRAVGGGLHLTNLRVYFTPNVLDAAMGGQRWECGLDQLQSAGVEPARLAFSELFSGGVRSRLRLTQRDAQAQLFVVSRPAEVALRFQAALSR